MNSNEFFEELESLYSANDNKGIESYLLACLESAQESEEAMDRVVVGNELACFYRGAGRFGESLDVFGKAQKALEDMGLAETQEYATLLINMAGTYRMTGRFDDALAMFAGAERILKDTGCPDAYTFASLYNNTAIVCQELKDESGAVRYMEKALSLLGDEPEYVAEVGTTCNNLAIALSNSGDQAKADEYIARSIEILGSRGGGMDPHFPAALNTRGIFNYRAGRFEEALADFAAALDKVEKIYGRNMDYAAGCSNCSAVCAIMGDAAGADRYGKLAQETRAALGDGEQ